MRYLKGVGPERAKTLERLGLLTLEDAFYCFPRRYEDRRLIKPISALAFQEKECVKGAVASRGVIRTRHGQTIFRAVVSDGRSSLFASWFNQPYLQNVFLPKRKVVLYGKAERSGRQAQMVHPEYELIENDESETIHAGRIVPVYPLTEDLSQKMIRQLIYSVIEKHLPLIEDSLPAALRQKARLLDAARAFRAVHFPDNFEDQRAAYRRLVFEEFFLVQLFVQMKKAEFQKENAGFLHRGGGEEVARFLASLGFELTAGQKKAVDETLADMKRARPMARLIQGDVGSGKTAVAGAAMVFSAANGFQAALMAPTEVLTQQHYFNFLRFLSPLGLECRYLGQGQSEGERRAVFEDIRSGKAQVVIGTHALIQEDVVFKNLGLAVVDEQHKFGVFQRAALKDKSSAAPHFLLMTATPIPRTLALTLYGDLDFTSIRELPPGRKPVKTFWVGEEKRPDVYGWLDSMIKEGRQAYVVCPSIEGTDIKSVFAAKKDLAQALSSCKIAVLHGRMKADEKNRVLRDFRDGKIQVLVSTVVVEVGIDVPNATAMIIEDAERFGLAQLHQLRGRVGRGEGESYCILFSDAVDEDSVERLRVFEETQSGFEIAEKDLGLRGAGERTGEKQHGAPALRIGDLIKDLAILEEAKKEATLMIERDPKLEKPEHALLKKALAGRFGLSDNRAVATA